MIVQARRCPSPQQTEHEANRHMQMIMTTISRAARRDNGAGCMLTLGPPSGMGGSLVRDVSRRANRGVAPALEHLGPAGRDGRSRRCSSFLLVACRAVPATPHDMVIGRVTQVTGAPIPVGYGSGSRSFAR